MGTRSHTLPAHDKHGKTNDSKTESSHGACVGEVDGLIEGAFDAVIHIHVAHGITDDSKVALSHGTCVGEVYGMTEGAFWAQGVVQGLHMTNMAQ